MTDSFNINLRSLDAFKNISEDSIKELKNDVKLIKYEMGYPICEGNIIPNRILHIIQGEGRLVLGDMPESELISKLNKSNFIGLASLLRAKGCESVSASSDLIALSFSDTLIIKLYKEDHYFQSWCNQYLHKAELYDLALNLYNTNINSLSLNDCIDLLAKNVKVKTVKDGESLQLEKDVINIIGSSNIKDYKLFDFIKEQKLFTRGPFPARIYQVNQTTYNYFSNSKPQISEKDPTNIDANSVVLNSSESWDRLDSTAEKIGQYGRYKDFKIIKANGEIQESLACLKMLAGELKLPYRADSIEKILRDIIRRGKKPNIQLLGGITSMMGLHSTTAKVNPKMGSRIPTPSLIAWKDNFAFVKESTTEYIELVAPSQGLLRIQLDDLEDNFEKGFIELLIVEKTNQTPEEKFGIKWLWPSINKYRNVLLQVLLASFVVQLFGLANPLLIQVIIDKVLSQRSLDTLQILGIALVVITIMGGILSSLRTFLFNETTNRIDTRLGAEVIDHLLCLPLNYFDRRPVGELGSRVAELEKIRNFLTGQALTTILDAAFSLIYIFVMLIYSWLLTLIALIVVPIQILITILGAPLIRRQIREVAIENAKTQSHLVEVLTGIQTVKAQNIERISRWKWQDLYGKYISKSFQKTITGTALSETSQVLQQLSQLLVLWIGARLVLNGELSLGQLIAFRIISGYVTQPLLRLSSIWQNFQELKVSFERLADIVDTPEESSESDKEKIPLPSIKGKIEFEDLNFRFNSGMENILKNINLKIEAGQFVGIVGESGSGKSTLMKLLPKLYHPNSGKIKIDGYNIDKVELYSLRRQIGIVPQEPLLFAGKINDNIALIDPDSSSDDIVNVSKIANAHDFIMELKDGYSTDVGERGAGLSGGQKQRIAIARTLLSNPKLLILDEATSALDYQTERKVCEGLRKNCKNSTVFFITHRLNTVKNADLIVMMHEGKIDEIGSHSELIQLKGRYFSLYQQQESD